MSFKAFIVGVNTLGLEYCTQDAQNLSISLEKYGYEAISPGNGKSRLQTEFDDMIDKVTKNDTLILYFSGHAFVSSQRNGGCDETIW